MNSANSKLQILFLPKWYPNDIEPFDGNFIQNYAEAIQIKCDVHVLFVHSKAKLKVRYEIKKTTERGVETLRIYFRKSTVPLLGKLLNFIRYIKAQNKGFKQIKSKKFDVCHIHVLTRSSWLALRLKKQVNIPFIISEHWSGYHRQNGEYKGFFKKWFTELVVKHASLVHVVSEHLKTSMQEVGLHANYLSIGNVVDTTIFKPTSKAHSIYKLIYVGNLQQKHKQIIDLVNLVGELTEQREDFELNIYGEGEDEQQVRQLIKNNDWEHRIILHGTADREGIALAMAQSHALILYSNTENQPCVINEAQACGIPVVVPDIEGIKERMYPFLGLVYKKNTPLAFKKAINAILDNHSSYDEQLIRKFAVKEYSEPIIAEKFEAVYLQAIANSKA